MTASKDRPSRTRRVRRMNGDDREREILASFEELLAERSLHEFSIDDIARGAGISRPTFYFYFPSKDAVLLSLLDRMVQDVLRLNRRDRAVRETFPLGDFLSNFAAFNVHIMFYCFQTYLRTIPKLYFHFFEVHWQSALTPCKISGHVQNPFGVSAGVFIQNLHFLDIFT